MDSSLTAAREVVLAGRRDGVKCPCCGQHVKVYRRTITASQAAWLIRLVRAAAVDQDGWVDIRSMHDVRGGDYAKLRYWGLLEPHPNDDPTKRRSGWWRPTEVALDFVAGRVRLPKHVLVFDEAYLGVEGDATLDIREALGTRFNYDELMSG